MLLFENKISTLEIVSKFFLTLILELALSLALALGLTSCGEKLFPEFKVENSSIATGKAVVTFSAPVRAASIKENFFFTQDGSNVEGEFSFEGDRVIFEPVNTIEENHCYEITIYTGAEDVDGNSLEAEYKKKFYTKEDLSRPKVLHIENLPNAEGFTAALKIQFSKKMNEASFAENFSIAPSASFITKWNDAGDTVELLFENELVEKTHYAVKIGTGAKDSLNNFFAKEFTWSFENVSDYKKPEYTVNVFSCNTESYELIADTAEDVDFSKGIEIQFNKKIDADKLSQNISIEPEIAYNVEVPLNTSSNFSTCAKINFSETPKWNTMYRLFISNITDGYGTCVEKKSFVLKNNSEKLRPPTFEALLINVSGEYKTLSKKNNFADLLIDSDDYQPEKEYNLPLYFIFRISEDSKTINEVSAMNSISVMSQNSCVNITPINMKICSYNQLFNDGDTALENAIQNIKQSLDSENANLVCVKFDTQFYNGETGKQITNGLIDFRIAKTLCDDNKNFMEEAVQISCNKK